jgi:hypothetical protein
MTMTRITLRPNPNQPHGLEYLIDPETPTLRAAVESIRHWPRLSELMTFTLARHGYGDTDGGFGVTYPGDLDEHDLHVDGVTTPSAHVQVYGFRGHPDGYEYAVPEADYLDVLAAVLDAHALPAEAERVRNLSRRITPAQT